LREISNARACFSRRLAQYSNLSASLRQHAGDNFERRRFAGSVGANQAKDLAFPDLEINVIERLERAIALG